MLKSNELTYNCSFTIEARVILIAVINSEVIQIC